MSEAKNALFHSFGVTANAADAALPEWIPLACAGHWEAHPTGQTQDVTRADLTALLDHLNRRFVLNNSHMMVDLHHQSLSASRTPGDSAPAAAWVDRFELRNDGAMLYGRVAEWTDVGAEALRKKHVKYISPVLLHDSPEMGTGRPWPLQMLNAALTGNPFIRELPALVNSALFQPSGERGNAGPGQTNVAAKQEETEMGILAKLVALGLTAAGLGVPEGASDEDVLKAVADKLKGAVANAAIVTGLAGVVNSLGLPQDVACDVLNAEVGKLKAKAAEAEQKAGGLALIANSLSLPADSDTQKILGAISGLSAAAADTRAEQLVANAVAAGKIIPANKAFFLERAKAAYDQTALVINSLTPVVGGLATGTTAAPPKAPADPKAAAEQDWTANSVDLAKEGFTQETYVAFRVAEAAGQVKQLTK